MFIRRKCSDRPSIYNCRTSVGEGATHFYAVADILGLLPDGILGVPWFQLKLASGPTWDRGIRSQDRRFLSEISEDKRYLEELVARLDGSEGLGGVRREAETALDFLQERRNFWSQQQPDYGRYKNYTSNWKKIKILKKTEMIK